MMREHVGAVFVLGDPMFFRDRHKIVEFAARSWLPRMYQWREFAEVGELMVYGPSLPELARRTAVFVDKLLKGAKPVEQPTTFEWVINLKSAQALGLPLPPSLLFQASEVTR